jgi:hypothetical protein
LCQFDSTRCWISAGQPLSKLPLTGRLRRDARALRQTARRWKADIAGEIAVDGDIDSRRIG